MNLTDSGSEQGFQALALVGDTGGFHAVGAGYLPHFAQDHIRVGYKVGIHFQPILVGTQMYPIRFQVGHAAALLQEQNVGSDLRTGSGLEGIIG